MEKHYGMFILLLALFLQSPAWDGLRPIVSLTPGATVSVTLKQTPKQTLKQTWQLPNAKLTPGAIRPLTQAQVCATKWGKDARHVTETMKKEVAASYKIDRKTIVAYGKGPCCEFDHLVSRELAGDDTVSNLWPQPWQEAKLKDREENEAHRRICSGAMTLVYAQKAIATDWVAFYNELFPVK